MKVNGIELLQMIKDGKIKTNTKINVWSIIGDLAGKITTIEYNGCDLRWKPGMFNTCYLYKDNYYFEIIEEEKKINYVSTYVLCDSDFERKDQYSLKAVEIIDKAFEEYSDAINDLIDEVNKLKKEGK